MAFSTKQRQVLKFPYQDKCTAIIADGSIRSGKSVIMMIAFITWAMSHFNHRNFALCSKTIKTAERNIIKPMLDIVYFHKEYDISWNKTDNCITIARGNKINFFYVFGGKDESSFTLIQGITLAGVLFDEVALMPESFVNQATARCSVEGSLYWFNCNPSDPNHWFYLTWIKQAEQKRALYLHFTMDDNPSLSVEVKQRYESMYEGVFYQRYIKGLWVKAEGVIYRRFADNPDEFTLSKIPKDITFIQVGVDFGGSRSATTFSAVGFVGFEKVVILEAERHGGELDPTMLDDKFADFCEMVYAKYEYAFVTRADSAEQVLIRGLRNAVKKHNLHTQIKNARKNEILDRIQLVLKLMGQKRFFVMEHCKTAIRAFQDAVWDAKRQDERLDDGTSDIDTLDCIEYAIEEFTKPLLDRGGYYDR